MPASESHPAVDLSVKLGNLRLANPVLTASGTCGYGLEYAPYMDLLNAIGLANVGLQRFIAEKVPDLPKLGCPVVANVAGWSIDDYVAVCQALDPLEEINALELNVSCPNVKDGLEFGTDPDRLAELLGEVRPVVKRATLAVKLSPNVTDIVALARAAIDGGAEVLSLVNTFTGMSIDIQTFKPRLANRTGGLSGPAIKPLAVHLVHQVYCGVAQQAGVPIIGLGGIETWQDALEFILAGASAVAVGTALFVNPAAPIEIIEGLEAYLRRRGLHRVCDLVGQVQT